MGGLLARGEGAKVALRERERELAAVDELVAAACDGAGSLALIEGPAGIGKTRVLAAAASRGAARGMQVLRAGGAELQREAPFRVARQLLDPALAGLGSSTRTDLLSGVVRPAAVLLDGHNGNGARDTGATVRALYWLCSRLSEGGPLLLAVDDVHWADRPSLRWLAYLAKRLHGLPVLVACACRPAEPGTASAELQTLADEPEAHRIAPRSLSAGAVAEIVRAQLDPGADDPLCAACHEAAGGNPFLVQELLATLGSNGQVRAESLQTFASSGVSASVLARIGRLPGAAKKLTHAVAVVGDDAELASAARLAGIGEEDAVAAADALARCDVLAAAPALGFVHPLVRSSIYEALPEAERARLHARAARMLFEAEAAPDAVATHLLASEPAGDAWVVNVLTRAAARASGRGAPDAAVTYLQRALAEPPLPEERGAVLLSLGMAESVCLQPGAEARLEAALEAGDTPAVRGLAALELGRALIVHERFDEAIAAFDRGIPALGAGDRELGLRLEAEAITAANESATRDGNVAVRAERLLPEADAAATPAERLLLGAIAWERALGALAPGAVVSELAVRALDGGHLLAVETAEAPTVYTTVAALTVSDRLDDACRHLDDALADARRRNSVSAFALASSSRSWASYRRGALADAEADARAALDVAAEHGRGVGVPIAFAVLADCLAMRGSREEAAAVLTRWWGEERLEHSTMLGTVLMVRGRARLLAGDPAGALADFRLCGRYHSAWAIHNPAIGTWRSGCARILAAGGELEEAHSLVADDVAAARAYGAPRTLGMTLRDAGIVDGSVELLAEAVSVLEGSEARLEHARALLSLGQALARAGKPADAREPLRQALDLAHRCDAALLTEKVRRALIAAGGRPRRTVLTGVEALTPSERRMAQLAASGLTNREIAEKQFLTLRAVEAHLSNSYRKLGIRSRDELAEALARSPRGPATA